MVSEFPQPPNFSSTDNHFYPSEVKKPQRWQKTFFFRFNQLDQTAIHTQFLQFNPQAFQEQQLYWNLGFQVLIDLWTININQRVRKLNFDAIKGFKILPLIF